MTRTDPPPNPGGTTVTVTYTFDNENNLTSESSGGSTWNYQYDSNGNRTQRANTGTGITETFAYDFKDRLSSYVRTSGTTTAASTTYAYMPTAQSLRMSDLLANTSVWTMHDFSSVSTRYNQAGTGTLTLATSFLNNPAMWECHVLARLDVGPPAATVYTIQDERCTEPILAAPGGAYGNPPNVPRWPFLDPYEVYPEPLRFPDINHWYGVEPGKQPPQNTGGSGAPPPAMGGKSNLTIGSDGCCMDVNIGARITGSAVATDQVFNPINAYAMMNKNWAKSSVMPLNPCPSTTKGPPPTATSPELTVVYRGDANLINANVMNYFTQILRNALGNGVTVTFKHQPDGEKNTGFQGNNYVYSVNQDSGASGDGAEAHTINETTSGSLHGKNIDKTLEELKKDNKDANKDVLVANILVHEVAYHGIGQVKHSDKEKEEGAKKENLDATRPWVATGWGSKCAFVPPDLGKKLKDKMGIKESTDKK